MHRFGIVILASIISSIVAPNVRCIPNRSGGDSNECINQQQQQTSSQIDSDEIATTGSQVSTTPASTTMESISDGIDNDDQGSTDFSTTRAPTNFRKRRGIKRAENQSKSSSSSSQEIEGSGEKVASNSVEERVDSVGSSGSSEAMFNILHIKADSNSTINSSTSNNTSSSSSETGSGEEELISNATITEIAEDVQVVELKNKVEMWKKEVDNYLQSSSQRRKRRQTNWPQLFSMNSYSETSKKTSMGQKGTTFTSEMSDAVGDALKPAMELMTQGVGLLSNLYTTKLTKAFDTTAMSTTSSNKNDTVTSDQFRDQLKQLQGRLGDLGQQLQRVVNSFQQLQLPFLDNIMSADFLPIGGTPLSASDGKSDKAKHNKQYKRSVEDTDTDTDNNTDNNTDNGNSGNSNTDNSNF